MAGIAITALVGLILFKLISCYLNGEKEKNRTDSKKNPKSDFQ